jgi:hypothetical protein
MVDWVRHPAQFTSFETGLGSGYLILFSFLILLALRLVVKGKGKY